MTSKTPLRIVLETAVVSLAMLGLAVAQRPLNIPNYLLSSTPLLQPNITLQGSLTSDDGQNFKDGPYLDIYAFDAIAGDEVVLVVEADFMDTYIVLYSPSGELIDYNDDLTSTSQSGLDVTLFESGRHLVVVTTFFGGETGNYSVTRYTPDQAPMELLRQHLLEQRLRRHHRGSARPHAHLGSDPPRAQSDRHHAHGGIRGAGDLPGALQLRRRAAAAGLHQHEL